MEAGGFVEDMNNVCLNVSLAAKGPLDSPLGSTGVHLSLGAAQEVHSGLFWSFFSGNSWNGVEKLSVF